MDTAIVTGASGFIGAFLVSHLQKNGVGVLALGRKSFEQISSETQTLLEGASYLQLEMGDIQNLPSAIKGRDWEPSGDCAFYHLAWGGVSGLSDLNVQGQLDNVGWAVSALEVAKSLGCSKFINVGTMEEPFAQSYLRLDYRLENKYNRHVLYALAKISAKRALIAKSRELDIRFFHVLHSHVMGPMDTKDSFLQTVVIKLLSHEDILMSSGEQLFDVIPVQDCVNGFLLIGEKGNPEEQYWVGSGFPRRLRDYVEEIVQLIRPGYQPTYGNLAYNDVVLSADQFSIETLKRDTGFEPSVSFRQCVLDLSEHLR